MPKPDLSKFAVISCDIDECQCFVDCIEARDADTAHKIALKLRPYANHADAWYASDLLDHLRNFERAEGREWKNDLPGKVN